MIEPNHLGSDSGTHNHQKYWESNIDSWAQLYLDLSHGHESLAAPSWFSFLYNQTIARYEARLMRERFALTCRFIDDHLKPGMVFADIGCGTGIFVVKAMQRGARVRAIDFAERSLAITQNNVQKHGDPRLVTYHMLDVSCDELPKSHAAIMMGVTPYIADLDSAMRRVLRSTDLLLVQYADSAHWANRLRRLLPWLNVRRLVFHSAGDVDACYVQNGWHLLNRTRFATGFIDMAASGSL